MRPWLIQFLHVVQAHPVYWASLLFFAAYPVLSAITWVTTGLHFYLRRERGQETQSTPPVLAHYPSVSVLIPAYCEEKVVGQTLQAAIAIDYPDFEIVVVDVASRSTSRTWAATSSSSAPTARRSTTSRWSWTTPRRTTHATSCDRSWTAASCA